jgi:poly(beta-D-mannuronate) lyase
MNRAGLYHRLTWILLVLGACQATPSGGEQTSGSSGTTTGGAGGRGGRGGTGSATSSGGAGGSAPTGSGGTTGGNAGSGSGSGGAGGRGGADGAGGSGGSGGGAGSGGTGSAGSSGTGDGPATESPPASEGGLTPGAPLPDVLPPCARMVPVPDAAALAAAAGAAMAGDCLVLADGNYPGLTITAKGTADRPIVVRAANRGKAVMDGNVTMMGAAYVVAEGLAYTGMGSAIAQDCERCRITRSRFQLGVARATGMSKYTRIDRNEFGPKNAGNGHYIHATESSEFSQIDRNYLHDATGGGTSRDAVSLGCCGPEFDYHDTGNVFEYNLMVNCSSDAEYISIKSSSNTVRYNTFRRNGGTLTLRAGRKNQIHGNFFFGGGGIRAYEDDHKIWNNYIETGTALQADGDGGGHAPLRRAIIVHNTFLGGVTIGGSGHTIANNIGGGGGMGNMSAAAAGLMRKGEVLSITAGSAAVDKAVGSYPFITDDLHGQARDRPDIGADEWSSAPELSLRRPLTPEDVGVNAP